MSRFSSIGYVRLHERRHHGTRIGQVRKCSSPALANSSSVWRASVAKPRRRRIRSRATSRNLRATAHSQPLCISMDAMDFRKMPKVHRSFAQFVTGLGYVSLAVDSFATRGIKDACTKPMPALMLARQGDALGALSYLSKLPFVDPQRIAVLGGSMGAMVALQLASTHHVETFDAPRDLKFRAAVAYYPLCGVASEELIVPTLILIGELDDWTPARDCELWMKRRADRGAPVKLVIYPGAYHAFSVPAFADGREMHGHWLKYDAEAAGKAVEEMQSFLSAQFSR